MEKRLETLSVERLEEDFVKVFQPIHILQMILGFLKVDIKYGFITHTSNSYVVYCLCIWLVNIFANTQFVTKSELTEDAVFENVFLKIGHVIYLTTIFLTSIHHFVCNRNKMSSFYVKLQKLDRATSVSHVNKDMGRLCYLVTIPLVVTNVFWIILYDLSLMEAGHWYTYFSLLPTIGNALDMLLCYVIIYFILKRLEYIEKEIRDICVGIHEEKSLECTWVMMLNGLQLVTQCLSDFVDLFQYQILSFTCQLLMWLILTVQCVIHKFKYQVHVSLTSAAFVLFTLGSLAVLMLVLCRLSDMTHNRMDGIKKTCCKIRASSAHSISKSYSKRMLLLLEVDSSLTVYNVYTLNSRLPFHLFAIIASYTIILLQFAML